jgi:1-deoxy-D-xylulose-5-phosphate reductoisomerase
VAGFLSGQIGFTRIAAMVEDVLSRYSPPKPGCLSDVHAVDGEARVRANALMELA